MANIRHDRAGGNSAGPRRGSQAKLRARERIAAERAARKHAEARRRMLAAIVAVTAVLAVVVTLVAVKLTATPARLVASESPASSVVVVRQVSTVPAAVLTRVSPGQEITPLQTVKTSRPPLTIGGKPAIVFVSEESPASSATPQARWPRPSTGRPRSSSRPSTRSGTTRPARQPRPDPGAEAGSRHALHPFEAVA